MKTNSTTRFEYSEFQKVAIQSIHDGNHTLITAHTGSGKTLPAEYAIEYFTQKGKKVIYTSPIKALSNQKYNDFTKKFPTLTIGLLTGDNKHNPGADVLIMTTEILRNLLFKQGTSTENIGITAELSLHKLDAVVFELLGKLGYVFVLLVVVTVYNKRSVLFSLTTTSG